MRTQRTQNYITATAHTVLHRVNEDFRRLWSSLRPSQKTALLFLLVGMIVMALYGAAIVTLSAVNTHVVILTEEGYVPQELQIEVGDTVIFKTTRFEDHWPASNVHPTHSAYSEFDPKKPIPADETWSFTFTEGGTYGFHDHINSLYEGTIRVVDEDGIVHSDSCEEEKTVRCWEQLMLRVLEEDGIKAAFDTMVELSETEPSFSRDCHGYAHLIGEEAYDLYAEDRNFELTSATVLCGYGFYHGFMETLLLTTGDVEEARDFCELVDEQLRGEASGASTACYHGTGHGAIDGDEERAWGDIEAMMRPGFEMCEAIAENDFQRYLCATGVYNSTEILSRDPKYGIDYIHDDPLTFCNTQPSEFREACYANMMPLVFKKFQNDFDDIFTYVDDVMIDREQIVLDGLTVQEMTTVGIMYEFIRLHGDEEGYAARGIEFCRSLPDAYHSACIKGLSWGHIKYGPPEREYVKNLEFCAHSMMTEEERSHCYTYALPRMSGQYSEETMAKICAQVPERHQERYCSF